MKYLVFSDLHLHNWRDFSHPDDVTGNSRLTLQIKALDKMLSVAEDEGRTVLFLGDLFHQRGRVATNVMNWAMKTISDHPNVGIIMIEGNHDNVSNSIHSESSLEVFSHLPNVDLIEETKTFTHGGDLITAVSYGEEYEDIKKYINSTHANIFIGHLGVEGAKGSGLSKLDGAFSVGDLTQGNFDLVLLGHYHKRQMLANNAMYVGNPVAQDFGDEGQEKGYVTFEVKDDRVEGLKFHKLDYPMFIKVTKDNVTQYHDLDTLAKDNYVRVVLPESAIKETTLIGEELPDNLRLEKEVEPSDNTRLDLEDGTDVVSVVKAWSSEFQPDNIETIVNQVKKVL